MSLMDIMPLPRGVTLTIFPDWTLILRLRDGSRVSTGLICLCMAEESGKNNPARADWFARAGKYYRLDYQRETTTRLTVDLPSQAVIRSR